MLDFSINFFFKSSLFINAFLLYSSLTAGITTDRYEARVFYTNFDILSELSKTLSPNSDPSDLNNFEELLKSFIESMLQPNFFNIDSYDKSDCAEFISFCYEISEFINYLDYSKKINLLNADLGQECLSCLKYMNELEEKVLDKQTRNSYEKICHYENKARELVIHEYLQCQEQIESEKEIAIGKF